MLAYNKFNSYVQNLQNGKYNFLADTLVMALSDVAPSATNVKLSDIIEISYTNLSSRNLTVASSSQAAGVEKVFINNLTITSTGNSSQFRYFIVYDSSATNNELIGWFDNGSELIINSRSFVFNFDQINGFLQLT